MKPFEKKEEKSPLSDENAPQRPKRNTCQKNIVGSNGLLWREETDLKRALYASLQETRKRYLDDGEDEEPDPDEDLKTPVAEGEEEDILIKAKVHAQRKFAQGSNPNSPIPTPMKIPSINNSTTELLPYRRPKTEDFLTFLCLRGTSILPPALDFLNCCSKSDTSSECRSLSPEPDHKELPSDRSLLNGVSRKLLSLSKKHQDTSKKKVQKEVRVRKPREHLGSDHEFVPSSNSVRSGVAPSGRTRSSALQALRQKYKKQRLKQRKAQPPGERTTRSKQNGGQQRREGTGSRLALEKKQSLRSAQKKKLVRKAKRSPPVVDVEDSDSEPEVSQKRTISNPKPGPLPGRLRNTQGTTSLTSRQILLRKHMQKRLRAKQQQTTKPKAVRGRKPMRIATKMSLRNDVQNRCMTRSAKHQIDDALTWSNPKKRTLSSDTQTKASKKLRFSPIPKDGRSLRSFASREKQDSENRRSSRNILVRRVDGRCRSSAVSVIKSKNKPGAVNGKQVPPTEKKIAKNADPKNRNKSVDDKSVVKASKKVSETKSSASTDGNQKKSSNLESRNMSSLKPTKCDNFKQTCGGQKKNAVLDSKPVKSTKVDCSKTIHEVVNKKNLNNMTVKSGKQDLPKRSNDVIQPKNSNHDAKNVTPRATKGDHFKSKELPKSCSGNLKDKHRSSTSTKSKSKEDFEQNNLNCESNKNLNKDISKLMNLNLNCEVALLQPGTQTDLKNKTHSIKVEKVIPKNETSIKSDSEGMKNMDKKSLKNSLCKDERRNSVDVPTKNKDYSKTGEETRKKTKSMLKVHNGDFIKKEAKQKSASNCTKDDDLDLKQPILSLQKCSLFAEPKSEPKISDCKKRLFQMDREPEPKKPKKENDDVPSNVKQNGENFQTSENISSGRCSLLLSTDDSDDNDITLDQYLKLKTEAAAEKSKVKNSKAHKKDKDSQKRKNSESGKSRKRSKSSKKEEKLKHKRDGSSSSKLSKRSSEKDGSKLCKKDSEFSDGNRKGKETKSPKKKKKFNEFRNIEKIKNLISKSSILNEISGFKEFKRRASSDKKKLKKRKKLALLKEKKMSKKLSSKLLKKYAKKKNLKKKNKLKKKELKKESHSKSKKQKHKNKGEHHKKEHTGKIFSASSTVTCDNGIPSTPSLVPQVLLTTPLGNSDKKQGNEIDLCSSDTSSPNSNTVDLVSPVGKGNNENLNSKTTIPSPDRNTILTPIISANKDMGEHKETLKNYKPSCLMKDVQTCAVGTDMSSFKQFNNSQFSAIGDEDDTISTTSDRDDESSLNLVTSEPEHDFSELPITPSKLMTDAATNTCEEDLERSIGTQTNKGELLEASAKPKNQAPDKTIIQNASAWMSLSSTFDDKTLKVVHKPKPASKKPVIISECLLPTNKDIIKVLKSEMVSKEHKGTPDTGGSSHEDVKKLDEDKFKANKTKMINKRSKKTTETDGSTDEDMKKPDEKSKITKPKVMSKRSKKGSETDGSSDENVKKPEEKSMTTKTKIISKTIKSVSEAALESSENEVNKLSEEKKPKVPKPIVPSKKPKNASKPFVHLSSDDEVVKKSLDDEKNKTKPRIVKKKSKTEKCSDVHHSSDEERKKVPEEAKNKAKKPRPVGRKPKNVPETATEPSSEEDINKIASEEEKVKVKKQRLSSKKQANVPETVLEPFPGPGEDARMVAAPVFYPKPNEFNDPLEYINKIRPIAERYGICRIVPPSSFKPECKVNDDMRFTAYNQYLHKMLYRWGPNVQHTACIRKHLKSQKVKFEQPPLIGGLELDVSRFYHIVQQFGGLQQVIEKKRWQKVADAMRVPKTAQDRVTKLYDAYCKYLISWDTLPPEEKKKIEEEVVAEHAKAHTTDDESEDTEDESESLDCVTKGRTMSISNFFRIARNTMSMWFKNDTLSPEDVEREYWRLVTERNQHVVVHTGNIDSALTQSGFPSNKSTFAKHPWNLKVLTNNSHSVLKSLGPLSGITVPTLHVGMLFTTGCWYRDPHAFPWIEYLHTGASKIWYGVPANGVQKFKSAIKQIMPEFCSNRPLWLAVDTAMVPPDLLVRQGASLSRTVQTGGQFVVIFPECFTSSVCAGYCISESVYFAPLQWLDIAHTAFQDIRDSCESPAFSLDRLLFSAANDTKAQLKVTHLKILNRILPMIKDIEHREVSLRSRLKELGASFERLPTDDKKQKKSKNSNNLEEEPECETCRTPCYISRVIFPSESDSVYCLPHALEQIHKKSSKECTVHYNYDETELSELTKKVSDLVTLLPSENVQKRVLQKRS